MKTNKKLLALLASASLTLIMVSCATTDLVAEILVNEGSTTGAAIGGAMQSVSKASEEFTPENEYYIGRSVAAAIIKKYPVVKNDTGTTEYLNKICTAITINSPLPYLYKNYCVAILDTNEINAISTPGGHILISRGLINSCDSEDALAAVIAHEIAHIQLKHSIKVIETSRITDASLKTAKAVSLVALDVSSDNKNFKDSEELKQAANTLWDVQNELVSTLVENGYSQNQEFDADKYALDLMISAGYNPEAMSEMLLKIESNTTKGGWNKTHPSAKSRNDKVVKQLSKTSYKKAKSSSREKRFKNIKKL